jgi:hypothetical protein
MGDRQGRPNTAGRWASPAILLNARSRPKIEDRDENVVLISAAPSAQGLTDASRGPEENFTDQRFGRPPARANRKYLRSEIL